MGRAIEVAKLIAKLPDSEREQVEKYIEELQKRIEELESENEELRREVERLKNNLNVVGDILQGILDNVASIQTAVNNIVRIARPVLRPRQSPQ